MIETEFTPIASVVGGVMVGLAATLLMLTLGRVLGATGILSAFLLAESRQDRLWRAAALTGMVTAPAMYGLAIGSAPELLVPVSEAALVVGGVLVGVGVTLASGCTSGHGVCGLARLAPRSFVATVSFMLTTGVTVFVLRHVIGD